MAAHNAAQTRSVGMKSNVVGTDGDLHHRSLGQHQAAADAAEGERRWRADIDMPLTGGVGVGGGLVLVDRAAAVELSRRALCAGLTALEQRVAGRWTVTSGVVSRL